VAGFIDTEVGPEDRFQSGAGAGGGVGKSPPASAPAVGEHVLLDLDKLVTMACTICEGSAKSAAIVATPGRLETGPGSARCAANAKRLTSIRKQYRTAERSLMTDEPRTRHRALAVLAVLLMVGSGVLGLAGCSKQSPEDACSAARNRERLAEKNAENATNGELKAAIDDLVTKCQLAETPGPTPTPTTADPSVPTTEPGIWVADNKCMADAMKNQTDIDACPKHRIG